MANELQMYRAVTEARILVAKGLDLHDAARLAAAFHGADEDLAFGFAEQAITAVSAAIEAMDGGGDD